MHRPNGLNAPTEAHPSERTLAYGMGRVKRGECTGDTPSPAAQARRPLPEGEVGCACALNPRFRGNDETVCSCFITAHGRGSA